MIITYSYLDQYKQIGLFEPIDYFAQTEVVAPASIAGNYGITFDRPETHTRTFDRPKTHTRIYDN